VGVGIIRQHTQHNMPVEKDVENALGDAFYSPILLTFSIA
jgi:hypothetical protein